MENKIMDEVLKQICEIAKKYNTEKLVLFGSRARGDNSPVSDYDIAVFKTCISVYDKASFSLDVEDIETLKKIDIIFIDEKLEDKLMENIKKEGIIIYEQTGN
jgi:predicted nucleotidyltransferase